MAKYTADWFSQNIPTWTKLLAEFKGKRTDILEIGCFEGRATLWLLDYLPDSFIDAVDIFEETEEYRKYGGYSHSYEDLFTENIEPYGDRVYKSKSSSLNFLVWALINTNKYDLIYIDGSHESISVLRDMMLAWELLKKDGIMICDDYGWTRSPNNPKVAIDIFLSLYKDKCELLNKGYQVALRKL